MAACSPTGGTEIYREVAGEKGYLTEKDWDTIDARQAKFLGELPTDVRARFEKNLENNDLHPVILLKREVDNESEDYYSLPEVTEIRNQYLKDHPNLNVARWLVYGGALHSVEAVDAALAKTNSLPETTKALAAANRDVMFARFARPINEIPALWTAGKTAIKWYFDVVVPSGKSTSVLKKNGDLNGLLAFYGYDVNLHSTAAKTRLTSLITGLTDFAPQWAALGPSIMWWMNLSPKDIMGDKAKNKPGAAVLRPDVDAAYAYYRKTVFGIPPVLYTEAARPLYAALTGENDVPVRVQRV